MKIAPLLVDGTFFSVTNNNISSFTFFSQLRPLHSVMYINDTVVVLCYVVVIQNLLWNVIRADYRIAWYVWRVDPKMHVFDVVVVHQNGWSNWYIYD